MKPYLTIWKSDEALLTTVIMGTTPERQREREREILLEDVGKAKSVSLLSQILNIKVIMSHLHHIKNLTNLFEKFDKRIS